MQRKLEQGSIMMLFLGVSWRGESEPVSPGEYRGGGGTRDTLLEDGYRYFLLGELELDI